MSKPTTDRRLYPLIKLGMHIEYLRSICSVSIIPAQTLVQHRALVDNLPAQRFDVQRIVEATKALLVLLDEAQLQQTRQVAEGFVPMLREMEQYLQNTPGPAATLLNDPFAERLVHQAQLVSAALKSEASKVLVTTCLEGEEGNPSA